MARQSLVEAASEFGLLENPEIHLGKSNTTQMRGIVLFSQVPVSKQFPTQKSLFVQTEQLPLPLQ